MHLDPLLLRTKLSPPRVPGRVLARPALLARLREAFDYRVTVVQAGTGYSKTTALAMLAGQGAPCFWYSVDEADADPPRFLAYLVGAFARPPLALSDLPRTALHESGGEGSPAAWASVLDALSNALTGALPGPALLVIDDYHAIAAVPAIAALMDRFLSYLPASLHVILATRYPLAGPGLLRWRAHGEVLDIGRADLAFTAVETARLFQEIYHLPLAAADLAVLVERTEGWPIALQLVWQGLRAGAAPGPAALLEQGSPSLGALFDYLAHDVLAGQPAALASFLRDTAVLRELTPDACAAVTGSAASPGLLDRLHDLDLFVVALGEQHYRYHHLFHAFLRQQAALDPERSRSRHRQAAGFFTARQDAEEAIYHWLAAGDLPAAAAAIEAAGDAALRAGWLDTVARWIDALPPAVLAAHPLLQAYLGDVYRLRSRFEDALAWYAQAEAAWRLQGDTAGISRALRGQALVYLDTVRPAQAERLLEEALRLIDGQADAVARARLIELLAENKLNMGQPAAAEDLRAAARALREDGPGEDLLSVRVKLRTGRLDEALQALEGWAEAERGEAARGQTHPPRAHRETLLILALIHAFQGQAERAFALAGEALSVGTRLDSPFVTAVGYIRLGHAWQLRSAGPSAPEAALGEAIRCYQSAIALGDRLAVRRLRAEAMWGLTRAYGFGGDLDAARAAAAEGVETARAAGDSWVAGLVQLALAGSLVLAGRPAEAVPMLTDVLSAFRECGDALGRAATRLWLALAYADLQQPDLVHASLGDLLTLSEAQGYDFLFTAPTLLGPPDPRRLVPLLLTARAAGRHTAYVARLLTTLQLPTLQVHPGYQLRVQTLGPFRVWRGSAEIGPGEWQRATARQLFQLLLTDRGRWWPRDGLIERLWPQLPAEAAARDFKVALNALNRALDPGRAPDAAFTYLAREGSAYRIRPEADLWLDAAAFEQDAAAGLRLLEQHASDPALARLQGALALYGGDFLAEVPYEDWAVAERERLLSLYLRTSDKLAGALLDARRFDEALDLCDRILARDPCWERAYRLMMLAYTRQGNRPLALRAYKRCSGALQAELGVAPSPATLALYERIMQPGPPLPPA